MPIHKWDFSSQNGMSIYRSSCHISKRRVDLQDGVDFQRDTSTFKMACQFYKFKLLSGHAIASFVASACPASIVTTSTKAKPRMQLFAATSAFFVMKSKS
jgi:hypothetical protein